MSTHNVLKTQGHVLRRPFEVSLRPNSPLWVTMRTAHLSRPRRNRLTIRSRSLTIRSRRLATRLRAPEATQAQGPPPPQGHSRRHRHRHRHRHLLVLTRLAFCATHSRWSHPERPSHFSPPMTMSGPHSKGRFFQRPTCSAKGRKSKVNHRIQLQRGRHGMQDG